MTTRATQLAPDHINALNSIDVVFSRWRDNKIREAWKTLRKHLATDATASNWTNRQADLKADLLKEIADRVGFRHLSADYLKNEVYLPVYHNDMEADQLRIRKSLTNALTLDGLKVIPVNVQTNVAAASQETALGEPARPPTANTG